MYIVPVCVSVHEDYFGNGDAENSYGESCYTMHAEERIMSCTSHRAHIAAQPFLYAYT